MIHLEQVTDQPTYSILFEVNENRFSLSYSLILIVLLISNQKKERICLVTHLYFQVKVSEIKWINQEQVLIHCTTMTNENRHDVIKKTLSLTLSPSISDRLQTLNKPCGATSCFDANYRLRAPRRIKEEDACGGQFD